MNNLITTVCAKVSNSSLLLTNFFINISYGSKSALNSAEFFFKSTYRLNTFVHNMSTFDKKKYKVAHLDGDTAGPGEAATEDAEGVAEDTRVVARAVVSGAVVGGAVDTELVSTRTLLSSPRRRLVYSVKSSSL
jgi:hypothetical protein